MMGLLVPGEVSLVLPQSMALKACEMSIFRHPDNPDWSSVEIGNQVSILDDAITLVNLTPALISLPRRRSNYHIKLCGHFWVNLRLVKDMAL